MSSFNIIKKVKYNKNQDIISLMEYVMFLDDNSSDKEIVFKFLNTIKQPLYEIKIEVIQLDKDNQTIEKSVVLYDDFKVAEGEWFVPQAKLPVNVKCEDIIVRLLYARFETSYWEDDDFHKIPISIDSFEKDASTALNNRPKRKTKYPKGKSYFRVKNIINKNISKVGKRVTYVLGTLSILALIAGGLFFRFTSNIFSSGGVAYEIVDQNAVVVGFENEEVSSIVIPEKINDMDVAGIQEGAFKGSQVLTSISIEAPNLVISENAFSGCKELKTANISALSIGASAFEGCTQLQRVSSNTVQQVYSSAFKDCTNLEVVSLPNALIESLAFENDYKIKDFNFGNTYAMYFHRMFEFNSSDSIQMEKVRTAMSSISASFFYGVKIQEISFSNPNVSVAYGALADLGLLDTNYEFTDTMEILNGEILSMNPSATTLVIPSTFEDDMTEGSKLHSLLSQYGFRYRTLEVEGSGVEVNSTLLSYLPNLTTLRLSENTKYDLSGLSGFSSLQTLKIEYTPLLDTMDLRNLKSLELFGNTRIESTTMFSGLISLEELILDSKLGVDLEMLQLCSSLKKLTIPNTELTLENLNLEEINITSLDAFGALSISIHNMPNLNVLNVSDKIYFLEPDFISNCPSLSKLHILSPNITNVPYSFIGEGMTSLSEVVLPVLYGEYRFINLSYMYTTDLTILNDGDFDEYTLRQCTSIKRLNAINAMAFSNAFDSLLNLESLSIHDISQTIDTLVPKPTLLKYLHIYNVYGDQFKFSSTFKNLEVLQIDQLSNEIVPGTLYHLTGLRQLYLNSDDSSILIYICECMEAINFTNDVQVIFPVGTINYTFKNPKVSAESNYEATSHKYKVICEGVEVEIDEVFIYNLEKNLEIQKLIGGRKFLLYTDENHQNPITEPYFSTENTTIYIVCI